MNKDPLGNTLIVGLGNILLTDEGIGVHIVNHFKKTGRFDKAELLDLGTSSYEIINHISGQVQKLIFIDCVHMQDKDPGTVICLSISDLQRCSGEKISLHQIELIDSLQLISIDTYFPETMILGIVPHDMKSFSTDLSGPLKQKFTGIAEKVGWMIERFVGD